MEKPINERMAVVENRLDKHDDRLNSHATKLDKLAEHNIVQDGVLRELTNSMQKNNEMTDRNTSKLDEIHAETLANRKINKTLAWVVITGLPALLSALYTMRQLGWL